MREASWIFLWSCSATYLLKIGPRTKKFVHPWSIESSHVHVQDLFSIFARLQIRSETDSTKKIIIKKNVFRSRPSSRLERVLGSRSDYTFVTLLWFRLQWWRWQQRTWRLEKEEKEQRVVHKWRHGLEIKVQRFMTMIMMSFSKTTFLALP